MTTSADAVQVDVPGIFSTSALLSRIPRQRLRQLVGVGDLRRVAHGWYATTAAPPAVIRALSAGGRLCCLDGCRQSGLWTPRDPALHVAARSVGRSPRGDGLVVHRLDSSGWPTDGPVLDVSACLSQVFHCRGVESGLMVLESAVNKGDLSREAAQALLAPLVGVERLRAVRFFDPRAESGSETRVRLHLQRRGVRVRTQVQIRGVGRVDLLVGSSWIIETDSWQHHAGALEYEKDRARDLQSACLGYLTTRLTQRQVFAEWPATQQLLNQLIADKIHRRRVTDLDGPSCRAPTETPRPGSWRAAS